MKTDIIYCGDCLSIMNQLDVGGIDAIITDLPYGTTSCAWDEIIPFPDMWHAVRRVLKPNGVFLTTSSQPFTTKLIHSNIKGWKEEIIWEKERPSNIFMMRRKFGKVHENIEVFYDGKATYNPQPVKNGKNRSRETMQKYVGNSLKYLGDKNKTSYRKDWDGTVSLPRSVLYFIRDVGKDNHPTQKPVALYEYLIKTYTNKGEIVLDMTMGSGTTLMAARNTFRHYIGIDISPEYCKMAEKRLSEVVEPLF